ncbi:SDR family NAD(P)-dependent oxidoreductase [Gayadomonas joobiniege]|uniref:SDR family NAD(P)-dependent oxidoreductase n=1 Tax=Gayadomonas joobiniege TaxID=1234606 RepID=UPI00037D825F|nr:SDR family oxidoreductase [Gayadomonas joobiniege]
MTSQNIKNAAVTGGGSGIGRSICLALSRAGHNVVVLDLNLAAAEETQAMIQSQGGQAQAYQLNVAEHEQVLSVFEQIQQTTAIDILINNAGIGFVGNIENTPVDDFDRVYQVNVKGIYNCVQAVIAGMRERKHGVIINMASIASSVGIEDRFAYSMSKGAVLTMTYSIARDYIDQGIRCNCVSPGRVHTPFVDAYLDKNYPDNKQEMFDKLSKSQPIGRMGTPEEIANLIEYLASDKASFITGSNFPIDGGFVTINN